MSQGPGPAHEFGENRTLAHSGVRYDREIAADVVGDEPLDFIKDIISAHEITRLCVDDRLGYGRETYSRAEPECFRDVVEDGPILAVGRPLILLQEFCSLWQIG